MVPPVFPPQLDGIDLAQRYGNDQSATINAITGTLLSMNCDRIGKHPMTASLIIAVCGSFCT
jgi:hypothetical protein